MRLDYQRTQDKKIPTVYCFHFTTKHAESVARKIPVHKGAPLSVTSLQRKPKKNKKILEGKASCRLHRRAPCEYYRMITTVVLGSSGHTLLSTFHLRKLYTVQCCLLYLIFYFLKAILAWFEDFFECLSYKYFFLRTF